MTLPGVTATFRPTSNASAPAGGLRASMRSTSSSQLAAPRMRLKPPSVAVLSRITGFSQGMLLGETISTRARAMKAASASRARGSPGTLLVASRHQASVESWPWARTLNGHCDQAGSENLRSPGAGSTGASRLARAAALGSQSANRAIIIAASWASSRRLPWARARWSAQSTQVSATASGEIP